MPAVTRLGDLDSGEGCFPPRPSIQASPNVFVNQIPVHCQGHQRAVHCCGPYCHAAPLAKGSLSVFANGVGVGRVGDPVACGAQITVGSTDVFAGG